MTDFGSDFDHASTDPPALDAVVRTDRLLDELAAGRHITEHDDSGDNALTALLQEWRDELRRPPAGELVSESEAVAALRDGAASRRRATRSLSVVGSIAATVLSLGGFGAVVSQARPGDQLYGLHMMLFGEPPAVHDDRIALAAKTELDKVQQMIDQGQWDQAQDKLTAVSSSVQTVNDAGRKQDLIDQVNQLNAKVATRDPDAVPGSSRMPSAGPAARPAPASKPPAPGTSQLVPLGPATGPG